MCNSEKRLEVFVKRLFFILFFFGLMLCACGREYGILDYQEKNISAECLINSKYRVQITKDDALCRVEILEPTEASGISFEISERGVFAKAKDFEMEIPGEYLEGICAIGSIFSQSEEFLSSATQNEGGSVFTSSSERVTTLQRYAVSSSFISMPILTASRGERPFE